MFAAHALMMTLTAAGVQIDAVGSPGTENTNSSITCSINPTAGASVIVAASAANSGSGSAYQATYGATNIPMKVLGRAVIDGGQYTFFLLQNVGAGSATVTVTKPTSGAWAQCFAVSYLGAAAFKTPKTVVGTGTSVSQSVSPGLNNRVIQGFANADSSLSFSSLSGGTNRVNENSGFMRMTLGDTTVAESFTGTMSSSDTWAAVAVEAASSAITTPHVNNSGGTWVDYLGNTARSFTVACSAGDYVVVFVEQDRAGDPTTVNCDGSPMTLMSTQTYTTSAGTGFLKVYRSASAMGSSGDKTIDITPTGSGWWRSSGHSVSNVTSFGTPTKTSGSSSAPSQSVSCTAGQLVLQAFAVNAFPVNITGTNLYDSPRNGGFVSSLYVQVAEETTTFAISNSTNWAAMAVVLS